MNRVLSEFQSGSMTIAYLLNETDACGMAVFPTIRRSEVLLEDMTFEPLVHLFLTGDGYPTGFSNGVSMRRSSTTKVLSYQTQHVENSVVETVLSTPEGVVVRHFCRLCGEVIETACTVENSTSLEIGVELLTSFALNTGVFGSIQNEKAVLHRLKSAWSSENRLLSQTMTELNMEESWAGTGLRTLRYGVVSSLSCNGYAPFGALEHDGATWAALLEAPCAWQIEVSRYLNDELCLSGGMGDFEFAQFRKTLLPGDTLRTPTALLTAQIGNVEDCFRRMVRRNANRMQYLPESEKDLPIIYNEFCYTWGNPSEEKIKAAADKLKDWGIRYFVIDAGWYQTDDGYWENNMGDWVVSERLFPNGLRDTADYLRSCGYIPGIWFEMENIGEDSDVASTHRQYLLTRNGKVIRSGKRLFWNFSCPEVREELDRRIIGLMRDQGFSYIKIDYNESPGVGCDDPDSFGAGLREKAVYAQEYYHHLHEEIPGLVLEVCSSGGHRNEPSFLALSSMNSFSDAHECKSIPIIAANVGRIVPARQNQIWCVLQPTDDRSRMEYSLAATFLGRMCLSGDLCALADWQDAIIKEAIAFYDLIRPLILNGDQYIYRNCGTSHEHPVGSQVIVRKDEHAMLIVAHSFDKPAPMELEIPEEASVVASFGGKTLQLQSNTVVFRPGAAFQATAMLLEY